MSLCTVVERILLHLSNYSMSSDDIEAPFSISQNGIAENLGISQDHASRELLRMKKGEERLIKDELRHVKGLKRKRKVYYLTPKGYERADEIFEKIKDEKIKIRDGGDLEEVKLKNVGEYIDHPHPISKALKHLDDERILDLSERKKKEDIFVGREKELEKLKDKLSEVKEEGAKTIFLSGEAGIGKTTLVDRLRGHASEEGFELLVGNSYFDSSDPYLAFKEAFDKYLKKSPEKTVLPGLSSLGYSSGLDMKDKKVFDAQRRSAFFESTKWVKDIASDDPLVIFLDDLQWADNATLRLLLYMTDRLEDSPILFIGSYRPEELVPGHPLRDILQRMSRKSLFDELRLKPLDVKNTEKILQGMIGRKDIPDDFVNWIHDLTEGNPLFIKECIEQMLEEGSIDPRKNRYPESAEKVDVPGIVRDVIRRRIDNLEERTRKILKIASVIGEEVPFSVLTEATDMDELDLLEYIDQLVSRDIWFEKPGEEIFCFNHSLVHLTIYEGILSAVKERYHLKVAHILEEEYSDSIEDHYSELAFHFERADEYEDAVDYHLRSGEMAKKVYAHEDAIESYKKVLELTDRISDAEEKKLDVLESLGDTYQIIGEYDKAIEYFERGKKETKDVKRTQRLYGKIAEVLNNKGEYDNALDYSEKGLSLTDENTIERCDLLNVKGWVFISKRDYDKAIEVFDEESGLADELEEREKKAQALHDLGAAYYSIGDYEESESHITKAIAIREELDDLEGLSGSYNVLGATYHRRGNVDRALEQFERSLELRKKIGDKHGIATLYNNIGNIYHNKGDLDESMKYYKRSLGIQKKIGDKNGIAGSHINIGIIYRDKNKLKKALEHYERSREIMEEIGDRYGIAVTLNNIGEIHRYKGDLKDAVDHYQRSYYMKEEIGEKRGMVESLCGLAETWIKSGDTKKAEECAEDAISISADVGLKIKEGMSYRVLGMVSREKEDWADAEEEFEKAIEIFDESEDETELSFTYYEYGLLFKNTGDVEKSEELFNKALSKFKNMGMELGEEMVREELEKLG